ncbi:hypothetical protein RIF29_38568 [Crotalaria pallida]|uniref:DUF4283 domain-containing protein n=1 Tax=Crotalaria pallida TaxID=3830 RepID=A0AAN9E5S4_CROPI
MIRWGAKKIILNVSKFRRHDGWINNNPIARKEVSRRTYGGDQREAKGTYADILKKNVDNVWRKKLDYRRSISRIDLHYKVNEEIVTRHERCYMRRMHKHVDPKTLNAQLHAEEAARKRHAWLRIHGVPIHAWERDFFRSVSSAFGSLERLDMNTELRRRYDVARILISTSNTDFINRSMKIKINDDVFSIKIEEEPFPDMKEGETNDEKTVESEETVECSLKSDYSGIGHDSEFQESGEDDFDFEKFLDDASQLAAKIPRAPEKNCRLNDALIINSTQGENKLSQDFSNGRVSQDMAESYLGHKGLGPRSKSLPNFFGANPFNSLEQLDWENSSNPNLGHLELSQPSEKVEESDLGHLEMQEVKPDGVTEPEDINNFRIGREEDTNTIHQNSKDLINEDNITDKESSQSNNGAHQWQEASEIPTEEEIEDQANKTEEVGIQTMTEEKQITKDLENATEEDAEDQVLKKREQQRTYDYHEQGSKQRMKNCHK